jgi:hypothetical protein
VNREQRQHERADPETVHRPPRHFRGLDPVPQGYQLGAIAQAQVADRGVAGVLVGEDGGLGHAGGGAEQPECRGDRQGPQHPAVAQQRHHRDHPEVPERGEDRPPDVRPFPAFPNRGHGEPDGVQGEPTPDQDHRRAPDEGRGERDEQPHRQGHGRSEPGRPLSRHVRPAEPMESLDRRGRDEEEAQPPFRRQLGPERDQERQHAEPGHHPAQRPRLPAWIPARVGRVSITIRGGAGRVRFYWLHGEWR